MAPRARYFTESCLLDGPCDPDAAARNGEYHGPCEVRYLPPGVCGEDLKLGSRTISRGQIWARGEQRVRIVSVSINSVTFQELVLGHAQRRLPRHQFLRSSHRITD